MQKPQGKIRCGFECQICFFCSTWQMPVYHQFIAKEGMFVKHFEINIFSTSINQGYLEAVGKSWERSEMKSPRWFGFARA